MTVAPLVLALGLAIVVYVLYLVFALRRTPGSAPLFVDASDLASLGRRFGPELLEAFIIQDALVDCPGDAALLEDCCRSDGEKRLEGRL